MLAYSYNTIRIPLNLSYLLSLSLSLSLAQALAIVGNLALLEDKIDFIVAEGGIPVLLSLVNGVSAQAVWDAQVRCSCVWFRMLREAQSIKINQRPLNQ